ncbi:MAG: sodium:solute symporter family protein [Bacteroidota bacterium]|nr:sodium:solute symporter family protein [Bacteroidota bacterium]
MEKQTVVIIVCCIYFSVMILVGLLMMARNKKASDFLVAGRKLSLPFTVATLSAVQIGAGVILGGSSTGASMGVWPGMWYSLGCGGGLIVAGILVAGRLKHKESFVPLDFFEKRYGSNKWIRLWGWISNVPSLLGIFIAQLLACGSILSGIGIPYYTGLIICAAVILIYSTLGGLWGIVLTDVVQTSIIMISIPVISIASMIMLTKNNVSPAIVFASPFIPPGTLTKFIYLVIPFLIAISVSYDAFIRYQAARDAKTARLGCILAGIVVIVVGILTSATGAAAKLLNPGIKEGAFSFMVLKTLNPLVAGVVIAAVLGAAMSSGSGLLIALGATFSRDLYNRFLHPETTLDELPLSKLVSRFAVALSVIAGILLSFKVTDILDAIIIFNYPYMGSLLIPLLAGVLWRGATRKGAVSAIFAGGIIGIGAFLAGIPGPFKGWVNPDLGLFYAYLVSLVVLVAVSKLSKETL